MVYWGSVKHIKTIHVFKKHIQKCKKLYTLIQKLNTIKKILRWLCKKTVMNMLKDNDKMPWGLHAGKAMINVPAQYLLWLLDNNKCSGDVKKYIEENKEALKKETKK